MPLKYKLSPEYLKYVQENFNCKINHFLMLYSNCVTDSYGWTYCRDSFLQNYNNYTAFGLNKIIDGFFYICGKDFVECIKKFLYDFQKLSKIKLCNRCRIYRTNSNEIIYLKLSDFWRDPLRLSLLTALIRASLDNSIECLLGEDNQLGYLGPFSQKYFPRNTYPAKALRKFVQGFHYLHSYQRSPYRGYGWYSFFFTSYYTIDEMSKSAQETNLRQSDANQSI